MFLKQYAMYCSSASALASPLATCISPFGNHFLLRLRLDRAASTKLACVTFSACIHWILLPHSSAHWLDLRLDDMGFPPRITWRHQDPQASVHVLNWPTVDLRWAEALCWTLMVRWLIQQSVLVIPAIPFRSPRTRRMFWVSSLRVDHRQVAYYWRHFTHSDTENIIENLRAAL